MSGIQRFGYEPGQTPPHAFGQYVQLVDYLADLAKQREGMIARIEGERMTLDRPDLLTEAGLAEDRAYNRAIDDAIAAIKELDK